MQGIELFPPEAQELILTSAINYQRYAGLLLSAVSDPDDSITVHVQVQAPGDMLNDAEITARLNRVFAGHDVSFVINRQK